MDAPREFKVAILGPGGVGKSCLTVRFVNDSFDEVYDPTVQDSYRKDAEIDGENCTFEITDTAGQEDFYAMVDQSIQENEGFILVYAINLRATFEELEKSFIEKFERIKGDVRKVPLVLVGNKCDLEDERVIDKEEAATRARAWGCEFLECSAKTNINVESAFHEVIRQVKKSEAPQASDSKTTNASQSSAGGGCCILL